MSIFKPADILIPKDLDFSKWSVVACDQFTSEPEYWEKAAEVVGDCPSTLNIIFPEVYLEREDGDKRIEKINAKMESYLKSDIFKEYKNSFIYVERTQSDGKIRHGIVGMLDLEEYDFNKGSQSKIRATEGTIIERIPPRQKIRRNAPLELPHILMLIDDRNKSVIEPLIGQKADFEKLYDFDLMLGGGHLKGYKVSDKAKNDVLSGLDALADEDAFAEKYGIPKGEKGVLLFAAGDGNHSLATAKTCWEELKQSLSADEVENHPARYALVELENIHDGALEFEPIQRVLFDVDPQDLMNSLMNYYSGASYEDNGGQKIRYTYGGNEGTIYISGGPEQPACGYPAAVFG